MTTQLIEDTLKRLREAGAKMTPEDRRKQTIFYAKSSARLDGPDATKEVERYAERVLWPDTTEAKK